MTHSSKPDLWQIHPPFDSRYSGYWYACSDPTYAFRPIYADVKGKFIICNNYKKLYLLDNDPHIVLDTLGSLYTEILSVDNIKVSNVSRSAYIVQKHKNLLNPEKAVINYVYMPDARKIFFSCIYGYYIYMASGEKKIIKLSDPLVVCINDVNVKPT